MAASYNGVPVPSRGTGITYNGGQYRIPDNPIIPFIEGDGTGRDIWKASVRVFDAPLSKRLMTARAASRGTKYSPEKKPKRNLITGFLTIRSARFASSASR